MRLTRRVFNKGETMAVFSGAIFFHGNHCTVRASNHGSTHVDLVLGIEPYMSLTINLTIAEADALATQIHAAALDARRIDALEL
jgi:hypothetical protein